MQEDRNAAMDMRISRMEEDLREIKEMLTAVQAVLVKADETISKVAGEVMPTIEELMKSPILKMLGMKK